MADRNVKVLTPATSYSFLTLDELKLMLGLDVNDTSEDAQLQLFADISSATCMRLCNRIFAKETIRESWRDIGDRRIFLSHWPVKQADITSVESPAGSVLDPSMWELEEGSGKVSNFGGWAEPVVVNYSGGYVLPDEAPLPLKRATGLLVWQEKLQATLGGTLGIRMISHHEARIMFHDPMKILTAALGASGGAIQASVQSLLAHYIHYEV